jgi:hypothetical protein
MRGETTAALPLARSALQNTGAEVEALNDEMENDRVGPFRVSLGGVGLWDVLTLAAEMADRSPAAWLEGGRLKDGLRGDAAIWALNFTNDVQSQAKDAGRNRSETARSVERLKRLLLARKKTLSDPVKDALKGRLDRPDETPTEAPASAGIQPYKEFRASEVHETSPPRPLALFNPLTYLVGQDGRRVFHDVNERFGYAAGDMAAQGGESAIQALFEGRNALFGRMPPDALFASVDAGGIGESRARAAIDALERAVGYFAGDDAAPVAAVYLADPKAAARFWSARGKFFHPVDQMHGYLKILQSAYVYWTRLAAAEKDRTADIFETRDVRSASGRSVLRFVTVAEANFGRMEELAKRVAEEQSDEGRRVLRAALDRAEPDRRVVSPSVGAIRSSVVRTEDVDRVFAGSVGPLLNDLETHFTVSPPAATSAERVEAAWRDFVDAYALSVYEGRVFQIPTETESLAALIAGWSGEESVGDPGRALARTIASAVNYASQNGNLPSILPRLSRALAVLEALESLEGRSINRTLHVNLLLSVMASGVDGEGFRDAADRALDAYRAGLRETMRLSPVDQVLARDLAQGRVHVDLGFSTDEERQRVLSALTEIRRRMDRGDLVPAQTPIFLVSEDMTSESVDELFREAAFTDAARLPLARIQGRRLTREVLRNATWSNRPADGDVEVRSLYTVRPAAWDLSGLTAQIIQLLDGGLVSLVTPSLIQQLDELKLIHIQA